jgi:hypothetical protein
MKKEELINYFSDLMSDSRGITGFVSENSSHYLFDALSKIEEVPLTKVQFDQLLSLQHVKTISDDFFRFYWLDIPEVHFYQVDAIEIRSDIDAITSLKQLKWGFNRLFMDTIFVYGNIQKGYEALCQLNTTGIKEVFSQYIFNTSQIKRRGNTLHFEEIEKGDRYLISEMACKTFADLERKEDLISFLLLSYRNAVKNGVKYPSFKDLLDGKYADDGGFKQMSMFDLEFTLTEMLEYSIQSEEDLLEKARHLAERWSNAHTKALKNTELYLSLVSDLDVYVATSMRTKENFLNMAKFCELVFKSNKLKEYDLRYFDPTISAADSHVDKGLIECLMVKSARMLIYQAGDRDSFGKDVEAAMALCLGKPTIFYCSSETKERFFRDVHPLSRLVNFDNGVAGGLIACKDVNEVIEIIHRLITNTMKYQITRRLPNSNYYLLEERITGSTIRVQTDNELLSSVFWNSYHT